MPLILWLQLVCVYALQVVAFDEKSSASDGFERLPRAVRPMRYEIQLKPSLSNLTFTGEENILIEVLENTSEIILNQFDITIIQALVNGKSVKVIDKPDGQKVVFKLDEPLLPGIATLYLQFNGVINDKMTGFYNSTYTDNDGVSKVMLSTQFESTSARRAFPCWDEPEFRAFFNISIISPSNLTTISNMPVLSRTEQDDGNAVYVFQDSPKMPSYLVAFAISEMEYVEAQDENDVLLRVYSRPGLVSEEGRGEFALETAKCALPFYGEYFQVQYPLPKLDMLAVPDFSAGAMENWGLVTYRERRLLAENSTSSPGSKQDIALVVAHELAHMWFGNLVTVQWWTDLWLKEGFATWIEYLCVDRCFPEMDIWSHFAYAEQASALQLDTLENSHPIEVEVNDPNEIDEIYDAISYSKGSSLIHMIRAYLGDEVFRSGLASYLAKHAYGSATTEDLWNALEAASDLSVDSIMRPWTRRAGFPVVSIEPLEVQDNFIRVKLSQQQYRLNSNNSNASAESLIWPVPLVFTIRSGGNEQIATHRHLLKEAEETISIPNNWNSSNIDDYLVQVNADGTGFYHVGYTNEQLQRFAKQLPELNLSTASRFVFINDGFALAKFGTLPISDWLKILPCLMEGERSYAVWRLVLGSGLGEHVATVVGEGGLPISDYHAYLRNLLKPILNRTSLFPDENSTTELSHNERLLRSLLVVTAGAEIGDEEIIAEAKRRFTLYKENPDPSVIPSDLRVAILTTAVRHGDADVIDYLMDVYDSVKSPEERSHILTSLGAARTKPAVQNGNVSANNSQSPLTRVLNFCLDPSGPVRDQDRIQCLQACASWSPESRAATWETIKSDWMRLVETYRGTFLLSRMMKGIPSGFGRGEYIKDVKSFFDEALETFPRAIKQHYETMDINQWLIERDSALVASTLAQPITCENAA